MPPFDSCLLLFCVWNNSSKSGVSQYPSHDHTDPHILLSLFNGSCLPGLHKCCFGYESTGGPIQWTFTSTESSFLLLLTDSYFYSLYFLSLSLTRLTTQSILATLPCLNFSVNIIYNFATSLIWALFPGLLVMIIQLKGVIPLRK